MKQVLYLLIYIGLALITGCTKPDRSEEADRLQEELVELGAKNPQLAVECVDSAEQAGVFTAACANTVKALIYENTGRRRMAAYYAEKAIDANAGMAVSTPADSSLFYTARWILADVAYANGEYGKSIALAKEILAFVEDGASPQDVAIKCRALSQIAECESELNHIAKAEQLLLQNVDMLMESTHDALQKAERTTEALALSEYMRQLTDSICQQERLADVEQLQKINRQEEEIASRRQTVIIYRILAVAALLVCMFVAYMFWRAAWYNKNITEKNRRLLVEIEQREKEQQQSIEQLEATPEESLTAEQQLYRRLCTLMAEQQPYTDENLNRETLAQLLGTNAKYVVQTIRECSQGETVGDFITRYRLEHVAHLLKTTDDPIGVVGELSGIPSRVTLSRLFRNAYGMTCREYRQVSQQKE